MDAPSASARGRAAATKGSGAIGSWMQRCKAPVKLLLARGAFLGGQGVSKSKLLRRLEEDGDQLLKVRALASLCHELPDQLLGCIGDFAGLPAPFAWRDFAWG